MKTFKKMFPKPAFFAVVHCETGEQGLKNADIALNGGANGIFLINHSITALELSKIYYAVRGTHRNAFIGLNFLDLTRTDGFMEAARLGASALWVDEIGINEGWQEPDTVAALNSNFRRQRLSLWEGFTFGGAAFKYQRTVKDPARCAELAARHADVVVTSGSATGVEPDIEKIVAMKRAVGTVPLAIASGSSPENARRYIDAGVDAFLCATKISFSHTELNPALVEKMARAMQ